MPLPRNFSLSIVAVAAVDTITAMMVALEAVAMTTAEVATDTILNKATTPLTASRG